MRLKLYSMYDHFPHHNAIDGQPYIACYNDRYVMEKKVEKNSVALLIEPRSLIPQMYEYIEKNPDKFKLVFTHDSILLSTLPNARLILYGGVWSWGGGTQAGLWGEENKQDPMFNSVQKTKDISFCSSDKEYCYLHKQRLKWARELEDKIDCMGTYNGGQKVSTYDIYAEYKFSVVLENYIDDYWFTEKICNSFANKCVPIYYGARKISNLFDQEGIVRVDNLYDLPRIIKRLQYDLDWEYSRRLLAIRDNYERVKKYAIFEDWFFKKYEKELRVLYEINNNNPVL